MTASSNRDRFKNNIERRVNGVLNALRLLNNCSNITNYKYTEKEAAQVCQAISEATDHCVSSFTTRKIKIGFDLKFDLIPDEPEEDARPVVDPAPTISPTVMSTKEQAKPFTTPSHKRKFTVRFSNGKEKSTYSPHAITCAVVAPNGDTYRVCDWFKTVREAHQYISEHPAIDKAIVSPAIPSRSY